MLRLPVPDGGPPVEVVPSRSGLLTVAVVAEHPRATLVRTDVLARRVRVAGLRVRVGLVGPPDDGLEGLGVTAPDLLAGGAVEAVRTRYGAALDVLAGDDLALLREVAAGCAAAAGGAVVRHLLVVPGGPRAAGAGTRRPGATDGAGDSAGDPLVARLALLDPDRADQAPDRLARWRSRVADWAEAASAPLDADTVGRVRAAVDDGVDTAAALAAVESLRPGALGAGCCFETTAAADLLLGLDLVRAVGTGRAPAQPASPR